MSYNSFTINVSSSYGADFWGVNVSEGRGVFVSAGKADVLLDVDAQAETIDEYSGVTGQNGGAKSVEITGDGRVVLVPSDSSDIITYDLSSSTFSTVASHTETASSNAFIGAALADNGKVIFAPAYSDNVGIYDPSTDTYTSGASHYEGDRAFLGATKLNDGRILFAPFLASNVGLYDPSSDTYTVGPSVSNTPTWQAVTMRNGDAILLPREGGPLVVFDPSDDTVSQGASLPDETFRSIAASSEDRAYCFPSTNNNISDYYVYIYDNVNNSLTKGPPPPVDNWGRGSAIDLGNEDPRIFTTAATSGNNFMGVDYGFDPNQQQHSHTIDVTDITLRLVTTGDEVAHVHMLESVSSPVSSVFVVTGDEVAHAHTLGNTAHTSSLFADSRKIQHAHVLEESEGVPISDVAQITLTIQ